MQKIIITLVIALFSFEVAGQQERKVAVFDPVGNVENTINNIVREEISSIVVNAGGYTVLERQLIDRVLAENRFQASGLVDDAQVAAMGRLMGANMAFVTSISRLGNNYHISFKMIDVQTGRIERQRTAQTQSGTIDLIAVVQRTVGEMFGVTPVSAPRTVITGGTLVAGKREVYMHGEKLKKSTVRDLLANSDALRVYNTGIARNRNGNILFYAGICMTAAGGYIAVERPFNEQYSYTGSDGNIYFDYKDTNNLLGASFAAAGAIMIITGVSFKLSSNKHIKNAVDDYNRRISQHNLEWKFDFTGNRVRLALIF